MTIKFFFYGIFTNVAALQDIARQHGFKVKVREAKVKGYALGSKTVNSIAYMYPDRTSNVLGVAADFTYVSDPKDRIGTLPAFSFPDGAAKRLIAHFDQVEGYYDAVYSNECHYVRSYVVPFIKDTGASPYRQADEFYMTYLSKATKFQPLEIEPPTVHVGTPREIKTYEWKPNLRPRRLTRQTRDEEVSGKQNSI